MAFNCIFYNMAYLEVLPQFKCSFNESTNFETCTEKDFCGNPNVEVFIDWENPKSIYNWADTIGLVCRPGWQVGLLGSVYYAGWCSTLLWLPKYSDLYGRKKFF